MYTCIYAFAYVNAYMCMSVCMCVYIYICTHTCMHVNRHMLCILVHMSMYEMRLQVCVEAWCIYINAASTYLCTQAQISVYISI